MHSKSSASKKAIVAYVPALHAGYVSFFKKHPDAKVFVLGKSFIDAFPRLDRDLRALKPEEAVAGLAALGFDAAILEKEGIDTLRDFEMVIVPDEDISDAFIVDHLSNIPFTRENVFLRWDGKAPDKQKELNPNRKVSKKELDKAFMTQALAESKKSADWWRQIGSVLVQGGKVIFSGHTRYFPSDHALDILGTPRSNVDFGQRPDLYISMHSEADVLSQAAAQGVPTKGASLYVSTFPCMNCAFLIARSGISKVYYNQGYSSIDSEGILKGAGVETVFVDMD